MRRDRNQGRDGPDGQCTPVPDCRSTQGLPPAQGLRRAEQARNLAADDDQSDARQIAADHRVGYVFDQPPDADDAQAGLDQARQHADHHEHEHDQVGRVATLRHLDGKCRKHRGSRSAGCADETLGAAQPGGQQAQDDDADDACQGAEGRIAWGNGPVDRDAEGNGGRKSNQHRGQTAPRIARRQPKPFALEKALQ